MSPLLEEPALAFDGVTVERSGVRVLDAVTATVTPGAITAVAGPSGAGKSTLLRLCNRLELPTVGQIRYRGTDLARWDAPALRREVGMVFQRPALFDGTVADNLRVARADLDRDAMRAAVEEVGLDAVLLDRPAARLSGGEAQRLCLARALTNRPRVLLADEPTAALDPRLRLAFERLIRHLTAEDAMTVLWVTHDVSQLRRIADLAIVLLSGQVAYSGTVAGLEDAHGEVQEFLGGASAPASQEVSHRHDR